LHVVIRIGGSVVASPVNTKLISEYIDLLERLQELGHKIVVVIGGGSLAREFIQYARGIGLKEVEQDEAAISVSRLIAQLFMLKLSDTGIGMIPTSLEDLRRKVERGKIIVMGGLKPGMTTDTVAAMAAEQIKADLLVKATDQEGIYTSDPRTNKNAKRIDKLSFDDLTRLFEHNKHRAGMHQIIDPEAVRILRTGRTRTIVVSGFKPENVLLAIEGKEIGTVIE